MASERRTVLLVEDHPVVLEILAARVKRIFHSPIIHTAGSLTGALEVVKNEGKPDLIVLDLLLPDAKELQALRELAAVAEQAQIVVFSAIEEPAIINAALNAGAAGYIPKTTAGPVVGNILRLVSGGGRYVPPQALGRKPPGSPLSDRAPLTRRQIEVLYLVGQGLSNKEIARKMGITVETVKQHLHAIYAVLGASSRMRAVVIARRLGIGLADTSLSSTE